MSRTPLFMIGIHLWLPKIMLSNLNPGMNGSLKIKMLVIGTKKVLMQSLVLSLLKSFVVPQMLILLNMLRIF